ncbi:MAG: cytochrome P460 family protein [Methylococcaceae bacterium]|nr:cytochrome P460 family protein [Methylococcaceae bacterium]
MKRIIFLTASGLALMVANITLAENAVVPYPEGYRSWSHTKSMLIQPGHALENPFQGIHHIYANPKALKGLKSGAYADGAVLVFDLLNYNEKDLTIQEGERKLTGVMHKDATKYAATGGWGFEGFSGNSTTERLVKDGGKSCFDCHTSEKNKDYVFSQIRP